MIEEEVLRKIRSLQPEDLDGFSHICREVERLGHPKEMAAALIMRLRGIAALYREIGIQMSWLADRVEEAAEEHHSYTDLFSLFGKYYSTVERQRFVELIGEVYP